MVSGLSISLSNHIYISWAVKTKCIFPTTDSIGRQTNDCSMSVNVGMCFAVPYSNVRLF